MIHIRPYDPGDKQEVISLWKACNLVVPWNDPVKDIQRKITNDPDLFFVGRTADSIVGSCMAGYDGHRGWIYYLAVAPEFRNQGIARKLVLHAQTALSALGCPKINLMVRQTNGPVIQFYKAIGFNDDPVTVLSKRLEPDT